MGSLFSRIVFLGVVGLMVTACSFGFAANPTVGRKRSLNAIYAFG
jgi:hypothetical protein